MRYAALLIATALLCASTGARAATFRPKPEMINVSHGWGVPFGGIGTGYCVFGKYGFLRVNFDGPPDNYRYAADPESRGDYVSEPSGKQRAPFGFLLQVGTRKVVLKERSGEWQPGVEVFDRVTSYAHVPKGYFIFEKDGLDLDVMVSAFAPLLPYDLESSTVPVQVFDVAIVNNSSRARELRLRLEHAREMKPSGDVAVFHDARGQLAFAADGGKADERGVEMALTLGAGEHKQSRFYVAWHYPSFRTPSPAARKTYTRYYAKAFPDVSAVIAHARKHADDWSKRIDRWHASYDVPPEFKRLWFGSLASVITSSMLSTDPYLFEVETPHQWVNTMDVLAYSNWAYLINWPQLERMDMDMFCRAIPTEGERAGFVWHSLWDDAADYAEEPTFLVRLWRDHLWFNDPQWLAQGFPHAVRAANRVYKAGNYEHLIESKHGNQSYDLWKMPGASSYVNVAWVYGLYALEQMSRMCHQPALVDGVSTDEMRRRATASLDELLWNDDRGCWNLFFRTPGANDGNTPDSVFTDQLFGRWMLLIDPQATDVLDEPKVRRALRTLYEHNLVEDRDKHFRGWVNGMLPGRKTDPGGPHARTFWICAQLDLGSLLGAYGDETASLDVFRAVESSLRNNHLAVGEWNQSLDEQMRVVTLPNEPAKDTPRFPPYPRYKCSWEYLVRMLGLRCDERFVYLDPFKTIDFALHDVELAGMRLSVRVESGWTFARVDGQPVNGPVRLDRTVKQHRVEFVR